MNRTLKSLAILKANYETKQDYLEVFLLFLSNLICVKKYETLDISTISNDFQAEYGLVVPYHPMQTLLKRASKRKMVKKVDGHYLPDYNILEKYHFSSQSISTVKKIEELAESFIVYGCDRFNIELSPEQAQNAIMSFLHRYDHEILFAHKYKSILADFEQINRKELYVVNQFIKFIFQENYILYENIIDLAIGHIIASAILYNEPQKYVGTLKNTTIYLDTRIILRLSGVEGEFRQKEYENFLTALKNKGATLKLFAHTYDEIHGIFDDCIKWIENEHYNSKYASPTLRYFFEKNYSKSDIVLFKSKVDSLLFSMDIRKETVDYNALQQFLIKEEDLYNKVIEVYKRNNYQFKEWKMQTPIWADVKSISAIYRFRQGAKPSAISHCNSIFVTTNEGLATANFEFNKESEEYDYKIMECVTDTFLGTLTWLQSPIELKKIQSLKIIADCLAAIQPDERLIERYRTELTKLKDSGKITQDEYYFLKSHSLSNQLLEEKTFGDVNEYRDTLPEEILEEIRNQIKNEGEKAFLKEKDDHKKTISNLLTTIDEKTQLQITNANIKDRLHLVSKWLANVLIGSIYAILVPFIIVIIFIQSISPNIQNLYIQYIIGGILTFLSFLNLYYGFTMRWLYGKLRNYLQELISKKIFRI